MIKWATSCMISAGPPNIQLSDLRMFRIASQDFGSMASLMEFCGPQTISPFANGVGASSVEGPKDTQDAPSWTPMNSTDPLQAFRATIQSSRSARFPTVADLVSRANPTKHLPIKAASTSNDSSSYNIDGCTNHSGGDETEFNESRRDSVSPVSSSSYELELLQSRWGDVEQGKPSPMEELSNSHRIIPGTFTFTLDECCDTPDIKFICDCCNEVPSVKVEEDRKPRVIPVASSQLGFCPFCRSNGAPAEVYTSHSLRSDDGKVSCPVLREYNCPVCNNGGGDYAHTIKYCHYLRKRKGSNNKM